MSFEIKGTLETRPAVTDLYDPEQRTLLVQYPPALLVWLGLGGLVAILLTGFAGYAELTPDGNHYATFADWLFRTPWLLFAWLCTLMVMLQRAIFRDPSMHAQRRQMLVMTGLGIALVGIGYYLRDQLNLSYIGTLLVRTFDLNLHIDLAQSALLALINYTLIGVFWVTSLQRWQRIARGGPYTYPFPVFRQRGNQRLVPVVTPSLPEVIASDLIGGGALAAVLWFIFQPGVMGRILAFSSTHDLATPPTVQPAFCATDCQLVDRNQMIIYLSLGLLVLALTALVNGMAALNAVDRPVLPHPIEDAEIETGTEKGTEGVVDTVLDTLLAALSRQGTRAVRNAGLALGALLWPFIVIFSVVGLAMLAHFTQLYLHGLSCLHNPQSAQACDPYSLAHHDWASLSADIFFAVVGGLVAALGSAVSAAMLSFQPRVAENTLRFMGLIGLVGALTFWLFALALTGFNVVLSYTLLGVTERWPFAQPEPLTMFSFVALLVYATLLADHRIRRGNTPFPLSIIRLTPPAPAPLVPLPPPTATTQPLPPLYTPPATSAPYTTVPYIVPPPPPPSGVPLSEPQSSPPRSYEREPLSGVP